MSPLTANLGYRPPGPGEPPAFIVGLGAPVDMPAAVEGVLAAVDAGQIDGKWVRIRLLQQVGDAEKVLAESPAFRFAAASGFVTSLPVILDNGDQLVPKLRLMEQDASGFRDGAALDEVEFGAVAAPAPRVAAPQIPAPARRLAPGPGTKQYVLSVSSAQHGFTMTRRYSGRKSPKPAELPVPLPALNRTLSDQRALLNKESKAYDHKYRNAEAGPLRLHRDRDGRDLAKVVTHRLAEIGSAIYTGVLRKQVKADPRRREILKELRDEVPAGTPLDIDNDYLVLPWNLIYDRKVPKVEEFTTEHLEGFWGYRFRISQGLSGGRVGRNPPEKRVCAFVDPTLGSPPQPSPVLEEVSREHRDWLAGQGALPAGSTIHLVPGDPADVEQADFMNQIGQELGKPTSRHLLYFFCHGQGAATFDGNQFAGVEGGLKLSSREEHHMSPTTLELWDDELWRGAQFDTEAVVFFNCCESAELDPFGVTGIVKAFDLYLAPATIVACNWEVPGRFAFEFAQRFLTTYLTGDSGIGEVIYQLRRELLEDFNPFGLVYSVYGDLSINVR